MRKQADELHRLKQMEVDNETLKRVLTLLRERLTRCEQALLMHAGVQSGYFDDFPDAAPTGTYRTLPLLHDRQSEMIKRILNS
jgi:hypothetical protein